MPVRLVPDEYLPPPLDGYRLVSRLGRGGFGEVWKVVAPGGIEKAAKFVFGDLDAVDEAESRPAEQEQKAINRVKAVRHPYILTLERFEVIEGQLIVVMELADRNLWDRFRQCRAQTLPGIPRDELLGYLGEAAEALDLMNDQYRIQHLDIKPQNLFLVHNHVKVADFGLAKDMEAGRDRVTITGGVTPVYAAPETFEGSVSRFTDQYSLAIVFQELLTGTRPFNGENTKKLMMQHINGLPDLEALGPADRRVIGRALSKRPEDRWPSCTELIRALRQGPAPAPSGTTRPAAPRGNSDTPPPSPVVAAPAPRSQPIGLVTAGQRAAALGGGSGAVTTPPRLVTPLGASGSQLAPTMTQARPVIQTGRMTSLGLAPPERTGDGLLFPALVVAVGQTGLRVVDRLRQMIADRFGGADALPTVRFLYLDTDPEALATAASAACPLPARAVVLAKLNRPTHYLQQGSPSVEAWLPGGLLYRLPKNPGAASGVRGFGRLALLDNARLVGQRVRQEVEQLLSDDHLDAAGRTTGLGVRSNRLRVYVVAGLAGGTGSGMAIDLGYLLKHELRGFGYRKPEAVGVLLAPPADPVMPRGPALANVFGALHEMRHFGGGGGRYSQRFDPADPPVTDPDGPFTRTALFGLPAAVRSKAQRAAWGLAARAVFTELFTAAGKAAETVRSLAPASGPTVTLTSLHRLSWPRPELLAAATRRFSRAVLERWASKEGLHLRQPIQEYLAGEWTARRLDPGAVQQHLAQIARDHMGEEPGVVFDAAVDSLRNLPPGGSRVDAETAAVLFDPLLRLVGKPPAENDPDTPLMAALKAAAGNLVKQADAFLSELVVRFIELPQYRLAGADEALAQLTARVTATTAEFEAARESLHKEVAEGYGKALAAIGYQRGALGARRAGPELADALSGYAHKRLRLALTSAALSLYRALAGSLPEFGRDVAFVRTRLTAMVEQLAPPEGEYDPGPATLVLPDGCADIEGGADWLIGTLQPEDLQGFDTGIQALVRKQFRGLTVVCQKVEKQPAFLKLLADQARTFLDGRLDATDPATVLLRIRGDGPATEKLLQEAFAKAQPDVSGWADPPAQAAILAAPPGPAGDRVRQLAADACPDLAFDPVLMPDDILVVRECPRAPLARLPHLGGHAKAAFLAQLGTDHPPHARRDVPPPD